MTSSLPGRQRPDPRARRRRPVAAEHAHDDPAPPRPAVAPAATAAATAARDPGRDGAARERARPRRLALAAPRTRRPLIPRPLPRAGRRQLDVLEPLAHGAPAHVLPSAGQRVEPAPQARVHRAARQPEHRGDLAGREAEQVAHHDDRALLGRRARRAPRAPRPDGAAAPPRARRRLADASAGDLAPQRAGARPVDRAVDDDPVQPRPERPPAVEAVERAQRREERLLRDVLGRRGVVDDQPRGPVRRAASGGRKSSSIAAADPPCAARTSARSAAGRPRGSRRERRAGSAASRASATPPQSQSPASSRRSSHPRGSYGPGRAGGPAGRFATFGGRRALRPREAKRHDAEPVQQAVPHDRGPDAAAAYGVARRWPSRSSTTATRPSSSSTPACSSGSPRCSAPATTCCCSPRAARARWRPRSPTSCGPATRCSRPAASSASAGSSSADAYGAGLSATSRAGAGASTRARSTSCSPQNADVKVVFATLSETSTGIVHDVQAIAEVARARGAMLAIDAVSGLGAVDVRQDEWGIDVVAAGSQKALMCPPGIALCSVSERALEYAASRPGGRYYFDFTTTAKNQRQDPPNSPFTPPVRLLQALDVALGMIEEEGLDDVLARHAILARATRAGVRRWASSSTATRTTRERRHRRRAARRHRRRQGPEDHPRPLRHHRQRRPGPAQGQDRAHRPHRLLRRVRHRRVARRRSR